MGAKYSLKIFSFQMLAKKDDHSNNFLKESGALLAWGKNNKHTVCK